MLTALVLTDAALAGRNAAARSASLEEALRCAAESERRKDEFLATLAHELRNQLGPAMNSLEVMKRPGSDAELVGRARAILERQVLHMKRLVDDLLDLSRVARNQLEIRKTQVDLGVILEQAVEASRPAFAAAGHTLTMTSTPQPVFLEADSVRLTQVFDNLLTNACQYTEPGGCITVLLEQQGSDALVRVSDTGIGIPPRLLERVFERFVQGDRSMERAEGGLGIGLAVARQLVEAHGGTITAQSEGPGRGSEFMVRLPILTNRLMVCESPPAPVPPLAASSFRILLVDDNRDAVESLALLLAQEGYDTRAVHDGLDALAQAESYRPAVILLDVGLPHLCGYEVCRAIRAQPWGKDMVVIALTGWGQEDARRRTGDAGFNGHLVKPVDYTNLLDLLARVGESVRVAAAGRASPEPQWTRLPPPSFDA